jgi:hypothetical protein
VEKRYYTAATLEEELRVYEARYGRTSSEFSEAYAAQGAVDGVPGFDAFAWAAAYDDLCRLRDGGSKPARRRRAALQPSG